MKQCEASMPVLYDKQWYENVADSVQSGLNTAGQILVGMGWGGINLAKDILLTPKYIAQDLYDFTHHDPLGQTMNFINNFPPYVLNGGLEQSISNQFQKLQSEYNEVSTEKQSEMIMNVLGNAALLFIPASAFSKFGKIGEAVEVAGDISKVKKEDEIFTAGKTLAEEKAAIQAEKDVELEQGFAQAERKREQAEIAIEKAKAEEEARKAAAKAVEGGIKTLKHQATSGVELVATPGKTTTVLGRYGTDTGDIINELKIPKNTDFSGNTGGFNLLNTPDEIYAKLGEKRFWEEYNKPFLDEAISRGDEILMATPVTNSNLYLPGTTELTGYGKEYFYLTKKGYKYVNGKIILK